MIDITRELNAGHPVWPGDTRFEMRGVSRIADGASVNVMALSTTTHVGTHLDATWHYTEDGDTLAGMALDRVIGQALVIDARGDGPVRAGVLPDAALPERVLLFTGQADHWESFPAFRELDPGLIDALADRGVRLLGTDAPSVDPLNSKDLPAHRACYRRDVAIVEGLALAAVTPGRYRLVCLPLRIPHADASPVRAILEALADPAR